MIWITIRRAGLLVIAATVHDDRSVTAAAGLTEAAAERRLLRVLDRAVAS